MTGAPTGGAVCPCYDDPMASPCAVWEDNESLCFCADVGLHGETPG